MLGGMGIFRGSGSPFVKCSSLAAASLIRAGVSLPAMEQDKGKRLVQREVAVWSEGIGDGW